MTQEEKQLLLKDLCTRSLYLVKGVLSYDKDKEIFTIKGYDIEREILYLSNSEGCHIGDFKPYLRSMSSMTENEKKEMNLIIYSARVTGEYFRITEYYNRNHLDYYDLIGQGLAIEAPEGMYDTK